MSREAGPLISILIPLDHAELKKRTFYIFRKNGVSL